MTFDFSVVWRNLDFLLLQGFLATLAVGVVSIGLAFAALRGRVARG